MWGFWGSAFYRALRIVLPSTVRAEELFSMIRFLVVVAAAVALGLNAQISRELDEWQTDFSPLWAFVPFALLLLYGLLRAVYEEHLNRCETERNRLLEELSNLQKIRFLLGRIRESGMALRSSLVNLSQETVYAGGHNLEQAAERITLGERIHDWVRDSHVQIHGLNEDWGDYFGSEIDLSGGLEGSIQSLSDRLRRLNELPVTPTPESVWSP